MTGAPDIATATVIHEVIPNFLKTLNSKYLGDVLRWVHNTGRYYDGYAKVRVDTIPELIDVRDMTSVRVIRDINDMFETMTDDYIDAHLATDIPILISSSVSSAGEEFIYTNYFA